ncbi:hypothetical protein K7472_00215 [Streptomyces sp. PTM05]|uniref:Terminase small subunit n=1 Tax=Streptantibioticus parmotrematis TaxID=2873249 RepID=A0ABS7QJC0_9ACTN|nr:hypothetical protein [Streptantibioticus parmotrematis]MBY8883269.1 hypothetical protein [Streptantibioticus parmotrematis]
MIPDLPPMPALTRAEGQFIDSYLAIADLLGRANPARATNTYAALRAAQALVGQAASLRDALALMHERGEAEVHRDTLVRALRVLDGERRTSLPAIPRKEPEREGDG